MFRARFDIGNLLGLNHLHLDSRVWAGVFCLGIFCLSTALAAVEAVPSPYFPQEQLPAPPEPPVVRAAGDLLSRQTSLSSAELYSIGDPTPEEQLYLELINRARANPAAEGQLFYETTDPAVLSSYDNSLWVVDLEAMTNQFAEIPPAPPLAMNAQLLEAARKHSQDMFDHIFQGHVGSDGQTLAERVGAEGYPYARLSENVFAYAKSVWHGHAGFEVDWGPGDDGTGMQTPPGHRNAIHNPLHREVGIGLVLGTRADPAGQKATVGPQLVTQDFGAQLSAVPFITGVVYYDLNGNRFYDVGEGIGGVRVSAKGVDRSAVTARSGGYALPVPGDGDYTVTFATADLAGFQGEVSVHEGQNVKLDYRPVYQPPVVAGPGQPKIGVTNAYAFTEVGGAGFYEWRWFQTRPAVVETASSTNNVEVQKSGTYDVVNTEFAVSPGSSFRLTHTDPPQHQWITLKPAYLLQADSRLEFQSRLGVATEDQFAEVEISTDEGLQWQVIYSQAGGTEEKAFVRRSVSLASYAGKTARFRFRYRFDAGLYYPTPQSGVGWYLDDIQVVNAEEIVGGSSGTAVEGAFAFVPEMEGRVGLQVRARTGHQFLEWGPVLYVEAEWGPPQIRLTGIQSAGAAMRIEFERLGGRAAGYVLEARSEPGGAWMAQGEMIPGGEGEQSAFAVEVPVYRYKHRFFRVRAVTE